MCFLDFFRCVRDAELRWSDMVLFCVDTPWDEPTRHSPEFRKYKSGDIFKEDPWNRLSEDALCEQSQVSLLFFLKLHPSLFLPKYSLLLCLLLLPIALLRALLTINPKQRLTLPETMQHPWCIRYASLDDPFHFKNFQSNDLVLIETSYHFHVSYDRTHFPFSRI